MPEDERVEQFYVALGNCLESARLAALDVELELEDGRVLAGIPASSPIASRDEQIDDTGVSAYAEVGGDLVMLARVLSYRVFRPV